LTETCARLHLGFENVTIPVYIICAAAGESGRDNGLPFAFNSRTNLAAL